MGPLKLATFEPQLFHYALNFVISSNVTMSCASDLNRICVTLKIRQMVSMMQLVMLTLSVKVPWTSKITIGILQQFAFILGSVSSSFMVGEYCAGTFLLVCWIKLFPES